MVAITSPVQSALNFFAKFITSGDMMSHHFAARILYKFCTKKAIKNVKYFREMEATQIYSELLYHSLNCKCAAKALTLDAFCHFAVRSPTSLRVSTISYPIIEPMLKGVPLNTSRAAMRLLYILVLNRLITVDEKIIVDLISSRDNIISTYATAALASHYKLPNVFSLHENDNPQIEYKYKFAEDIVRNTLKLFGSSSSSSYAAQYFGAILLLRLSDGPAQNVYDIFHNLPISSIAKTVTKYLPSNDGLVDHFTTIAIFLAKTILNLWNKFRSVIPNNEENSGKLSDYFDSITNMITSVLLTNKEYEKFSYLGFLQSIIIDLVDKIIESNLFSDILNSPHIRTALEKLRQLVGADIAHELSLAKKQIGKLEAQNKSLTQEYQQISEAKDNEIKKLQDIISADNNSHSIRIKSAGEILELTKQVMKLKGDISKVESTLHQRDNEIKHLKQDQQQLFSKYNEEVSQPDSPRRREFSRLANDVADKTTEIKQLRDLLEGKGDVNALLVEKGEQIDRLNAEVVDLRKKLQEKLNEESNQSYLQAQVDHLQKENEELRNKIADQRNEIEELRLSDTKAQAVKVELAEARLRIEQLESHRDST